MRADCNASQPGFRKFLRWVEVQASPIDPDLVSGFQWEHKEAAADALFDLLQSHTTDDAQQLVKLLDDNGPEAWRQLSIRYDPIGESYVFDQMSALLEVPRCKQLTELPSAITLRERSLRLFAEKTGGQVFPAEYKLPILFKMISASLMQDIKVRHKYAVGEEKLYPGFSKILIEMANGRTYDRQASKGKNDMDVDAIEAEKAARQAAFARQAEYEKADRKDYGKDHYGCRRTGLRKPRRS